MQLAGLADTIEYVPDWNENKSLPESEQVKVTIKIPTVTEYNEFVNLVQGDRGHMFETNISKISKCIIKVENLVIGGVYVKNGEALLHYVQCTDLLDEISAYIIHLKKT